MRVSDGVAEFEAVELPGGLVLCRGAKISPRLYVGDEVWHGHAWLSERRHLGERRKARINGGVPRRYSDHTSVAADLERAVLARKLRLERRPSRPSDPTEVIGEARPPESAA